MYKRKDSSSLVAAAAAKTPSSLGMLVFQAQLKEYDNRHGDAAADYRRLLDRDGRNVIALNNLAFILALKDGNTEEALALVNRAIEIAGPHPELLDTRAVVHVKAGNAPLAVEDMGQAIVAEPSGLKYFHMAQAKLLAKDKPAAEEAFQKAGELGLKNTDLHALERSEYSQVAKGIKAR